MLLKLRKTMYGTRDAAQTWQRKRSETVRELGFPTISSQGVAGVGLGALRRLRLRRGA